jgi:hypothetical protein
MTNAARLLAVAALVLCAAPAFAQNAPDPGQELPLQAEPGSTSQIECIDENDHYTMNGKQPIFVIELTN